MMKKYLILVLFCFELNAVELKCGFEEVYQDGKTQQGFFLMKKNKIRYQYYDQNLITIFSNSDKIFYVPNNNTSLFYEIQYEQKIIKELFDIFQTFPIKKNQYIEDDLVIKADLGENFFRRVSVQSKDTNLSIFFIECKYEKVSDGFFFHSPYLNF